MKRKSEPVRKKISAKQRRKRARRLRRRLGVAAALLAAILALPALRTLPGLGGWLWAGAALLLAVEAALLTRRRAASKAVCALLGVLCLALIAGGWMTRGYVLTDQGMIPSEAGVEELRVTDAWPANIDRYTGLKVLDMRGSTVTDFSPLTSLRELKVLDVRGNYAFDRQACDAVSRALPLCKVLWSIPVGDRYIDSEAKEVDLTGATLSAAQIAALQREYPDKQFTYAVTLMGKAVDPSEEALDLRGAEDIDPDELGAALSLLPNVREVDLRGAPVAAQVVEALCESYPDIHFMFTCAVPGNPMTTEDETVTLAGGTYEDLRAYMAFIDFMPNLRYIDARAIAMNDAELAALQADPRSAKVMFAFTAFGLNVNPLDGELNLDNIPVQSAAQVEQVIARMPNLRRVSMCNCGLSEADMGMLFDAHPDIKFVWWVEFGKYRLRTDATAFTTNLYANNKFHYTSQTFAPLRYCTDLLMLDLGHCDITSIEGLSGLKKLRVLILADNEITDISPLAGMEDLEYVELFLNRITDFTPLANKTKLLDLNIYYNPIADVTPLTTCTSLQRLWLGQCGLSDGEIGKLRQALPDCKINAKGSSSTGRGWREHKHYNTLKDMYRQGTYIPFD